MVTRKKRAGRPVGFHRMLDGTRVDGLIKLKDGRWRISGPEKTTFTEHDEARAVRRAMDIIEKRKGVNNTAMIRVGEYPDYPTAVKAFQKIIDEGEDRYVFDIPDDGSPGPVTLEKSFDTAEVWAYVAETILNNPAYAARRSGIECLAWLPDIKKPAPSPTLDEVGKFYYDRTDLSPKEAQKCRTTWQEFSRAVGVTTVRDITVEAVGQWGLKVKATKAAPKTIYHAFNRVKTILSQRSKQPLMPESNPHVQGRSSGQSQLICTM